MRRITVAGVLAIAASIFVFSDLASMQGRRREVQLVNGREAVAREVLVKFRNPADAAVSSRARSLSPGRWQEPSARTNGSMAVGHSIARKVRATEWPAPSRCRRW